MQNKGLVKLFAILFGLVSIYQISFTFKANQIEKQAEKAAALKFQDPADINDEVIRYLDSLSLSNESVYNLGIAKHTYSEVRDKTLNLGLDLKGGINVILEISVKEILSGLANYTKDPVFNKALEDATEIQKNSQNSYVEDFFTAFDKIKGDKRLASPEIFGNRSLSEEVTLDMTDAQVKSVISRKVDESVISAYEVLKKRIDEFGVTQPNVQRLGNTGRILVELPGIKDIERATSLLQSTAQLEFWDAYRGEQFLPFLAQANETLKTLVSKSTKETSDAVTEKDSISEAEDKIKQLTGVIETDSTQAGENPILDLLRGYGTGGPVVATFEAKHKDLITSYLNKPEVRALLPADQRYVKFAWGVKAKSSEFIDLYALAGNRENIPELSGAVVVDARQSYNQLNRPSVSMQMNGKGAKIWEEMTGRAYAQQSQIAIVLDGVVYSAPGVTSGPISGGSSEISGAFTLNEAIDLANVLRAGKLPAKAEIIQSEVVGPSLGQEAINSGTISSIVSLFLVFVFVLLYYGKGGISAVIALVANLLLIFGVLAGIGAVLTLPGIAGIVLTIAMAVDANVLIFERIKEEQAKGKGLKEAVKDGFTNALSAILDSNITTALIGVVLLLFGSGPVKGFATTLLIGIATSLFTALFVTSVVIDWYVSRKTPLTFVTNISKNLFKNPNYDFLTKRRIPYLISGIIFVVGIGSLFTQGLNQGVDFVGGRTFTVRFDKPISASKVHEELADVFNSVEVKTFGGANQLKITTKYKIEETGTEVDEEIKQMLFDGLKPNLPNDLTYDDFTKVNEIKDIGILQSVKVGPTIADDIKKNAVWAILGALVLMFLYILMRFRNWQYGFGATAALFHDAFLVVAVYSLAYKFMPFSLEIDQAFIAAILTVIGYSLNDTVVIFDRIREYNAEYPGWSLEKKINDSVNSTLGRTFITSASTLLVLLAIFIFGGESMKSFMFAMIIGVVSGVYSTLFIATPLYYDTMKNKTIEEEVKA